MNPRLRVLVVDDERLSRISMVCQLKDAAYEAEACESAQVALAALARATWDVVVTDLRMPGMSGLELLGEIRRQYPGVDVIVITAYGNVETAVDAMRAGAADFLTKPFGFSELDFRLKKLAELRAARSEVNSLRALIDDACKCGLVGSSPAMARVCERISAFAGHDAPVLITGETGTGKEMVARALHNQSPRAGKPFIAVGCGTIPRELAESELFGHEKGAFTGASQRRKGSFERADGGTLLLDDIDDLPLDLQVKLLRVLQEGTLTRVGGSEEIKVDVRVVATSKVDLDKAAAAGKFRDDVFYRLRGLEIRLPPLRERGDDVLILAQHFLRAIAAHNHAQPKTLSPEAARVLRACPWRGNVRELRRAIETAVVLCPAEEIKVEHLPEYLNREATPEGRNARFALELNGCEHVNLKELVTQFEDSVIEWAMRKSDGQQAKAADLLGLPRTTFQSRIGRKKDT